MSDAPTNPWTLPVGEVLDLRPRLTAKAREALGLPVNGGCGPCGSVSVPLLDVPWYADVERAGGGS